MAENVNSDRIVIFNISAGLRISQPAFVITKLFTDLKRSPKNFCDIGDDSNNETS